LVDALDNDQALSEEKVVDIVNARSREGIEEYRRFLKSGSLVSVLNQSWNATPQLQELAISLRNENIDGAKAILLATPSFGSFARHVSNTLVGTKVNQDSFGRAITTYRTLGEAMLLCAEIEGEGIYSTPNSPDAEHFAPIALQRFRNLDNGDGLVATGEWFESLIRKDGIHPEIARQRLNDASARELLRRSTEGSTTDVRFDRHVIHVLRVESGKPAVITVHLYRGDYLIPGKSSTSLRIEGI